MALQSTIQAELFKDLIEIEVNGFCVDLHNDYDCLKLRFADGDLLMSFKSIRDNSQYPLVMLKFKAAEIQKLQIDFGIDPKNKTIDRLHRCRFLQDNRLIEYSKDGKSFYILEFCEGYSLQFFSSELQLVLQ